MIHKQLTYLSTYGCLNTTPILNHVYISRIILGPCIIHESFQTTYSYLTCLLRNSFSVTDQVDTRGPGVWYGLRRLVPDRTSTVRPTQKPYVPTNPLKKKFREEGRCQGPQVWGETRNSTRAPVTTTPTTSTSSTTTRTDCTPMTGRSLVGFTCTEDTSPVLTASKKTSSCFSLHPVQERRVTVSLKRGHDLPPKTIIGVRSTPPCKSLFSVERVLVYRRLTLSVLRLDLSLEYKRTVFGRELVTKSTTGSTHRNPYKEWRDSKVKEGVWDLVVSLWSHTQSRNDDFSTHKPRLLKVSNYGGN